MHHPGDTSLNVRAKIIDPTNQSLIGGVFATVAGQAITKDGFFYQDASGAVNPSSIVAADENTLELVFPRVLEDGDLNIYGSWVSLVASGGLQASDAILEYFADTGSGGMAVEPSETDSL